MNDEQRKFKIGPWGLFLIIAIIGIILWLSTPFFVLEYLEWKYPESEIPSPSIGEVGDLFGSINAIFSALALAGVIFTMVMQRKELEAQRNELKDTRTEFQLNRLTNIIYKQLERIEPKIKKVIFSVSRANLKHHEFKPERTHSEGEEAFMSLDILVDEIMPLIEKLDVKFFSILKILYYNGDELPDVLDSINTSIHIIKKLIEQNKKSISQEQESELMTIFFENIDPRVIKCFEGMYVLSMCLEKQYQKAPNSFRKSGKALSWIIDFGKHIKVFHDVLKLHYRIK